MRWPVIIFYKHRQKYLFYCRSEGIRSYQN
jgi:hypothetical protein